MAAISIVTQSWRSDGNINQAIEINLLYTYTVRDFLEGLYDSTHRHTQQKHFY